MMIRSIRKNKATLGADKGYDVHEFVQAARDRGVTPHVAKKAKGSAIDGRTTRHQRIEEIFGWAKTVTFAAYNLIRMAAIFGWKWSPA